MSQQTNEEEDSDDNEKEEENNDNVENPQFPEASVLGCSHQLSTSTEKE